VYNRPATICLFRNSPIVLANLLLALGFHLNLLHAYFAASQSS
jgi:hypothetical protein